MVGRVEEREGDGRGRGRGNGGNAETAGQKLMSSKGKRRDDGLTSGRRRRDVPES